MGWQPSASKTEILLLCPRPFDPAIEAASDEPGEPARYGSAFHSLLAECLRPFNRCRLSGSVSKRKMPFEKSAGYARMVDRVAREFDVKDAKQELASHVKSSVKVLRNWLVREKLEISEIEKAYAIRPQADGTWRTRTIIAHDGDHHYAVGPDELPGTVDLIARNANGTRAVVIDHKTGLFEDWFANDESVKFALPTTVAQLRTLGLVVASSAKRPKMNVEIGIFHADRKGLPMVYAERYEPADQRQHAKELHAAFQRIGQGGFMRPGEYCKRCPARVGCPARAAHLLVESAEVLVEAANALAVEPVDPLLPTEPPPTGMLEVRAGALYDLLKRFRELEKAGAAEIKRLVRLGAVIETRDGKVLALQTQTFETLSKKSVIEAFGKVKGERELERLRKKGAIRESTRELLIGEK